jgi:5-methylcytosine-specific restriction endonuclease McrA
MPYSTKEKRQEHARRPEVRERTNRLKREREAKNREKYNARMREWNKNNPLRSREINSKSGLKNRTAIKKEVFLHYANPLRCVCCGVKGIEFLTVDHIIPKRNMAKDEKLIQMGFTSRLKAEKLNRWLKNNNFPKGFQILCWNCNFAKGVLGKCPHKGIKAITNQISRD